MELSQVEYDAMKAKLEAAERKLAIKSKLTMKVSGKGGVSVYGLGKFPVTLYSSQWNRLLADAPAIEAFLTAHTDELATKS